MDEDMAWKNFQQSGKIEDYNIYYQYKNGFLGIQGDESQNAFQGKRTDTKGITCG